MKQKEIKIGGKYLAKVSGQITTVRVEDIREVFDHRDKSSTRYDCVNLRTMRRITFRSAMKFRCEVLPGIRPTA
jgi:hypothetical protein